jgi:hypothetical protein
MSSARQDPGPRRKIPTPRLAANGRWAIDVRTHLGKRRTIWLGTDGVIDRAEAERRCHDVVRELDDRMQLP